MTGYWCLCLFFCKQKTAYELRISDWSADVCSSDLACRTLAGRLSGRTLRCKGHGLQSRRLPARVLPRRQCALPGGRHGLHPKIPRCARTGPYRPGPRRPVHRSEEHTSELQSLMRISYAVFCLKKKKKKYSKLIISVRDSITRNM